MLETHRLPLPEDLISVRYLHLQSALRDLLFDKEDTTNESTTLEVSTLLVFGVRLGVTSFARGLNTRGNYNNLGTGPDAVDRKHRPETRTRRLRGKEKIMKDHVMQTLCRASHLSF